MNRLMQLALITMLFFLAEPIFGAVKITPIATSEGAPKFNGFTFPHMNNFGVTFSGYQGNYSVIARADDGKLDILASTEDGDFLGFGMPSLFNSRAAYLAQYASDSSLGVFVNHDGDQSMVANVTTTVPNTDWSFSTFSAPAMGPSSVAFVGSVNVHDFTGLFQADESGIREIANTSTPIPTNPSLTFLCISSPSVLDDDEVIFFGSHCSDSTLLSHSMLRTRHVSDHAVNFKHLSPGIWAADDKSIRKIVDASNAVPNNVNETFEAFSLPATSGKNVAFVGLGTTSTMGIYAVDKTEGEVVVIADTTTKVPDTQVTFSDFPNNPSIAEDGTVAFYGATSGVTTGIYVKAAGSDTIVKLITLGDQVLGQNLVYLGFGEDALVSEIDAMTGTHTVTVTFYAVLENDEMGVFTLSASL